MPGHFQRVAIRAGVDRQMLVKLCLDIFSPVWRKGLEKEILSIDNNKRIPLPERYMGFPPGLADLDTAP